MLKRARLLCYLVVCVSRAVLSVVLGAWSVRFVGWADWVDCRCFLSFVFLGVARRLELSPYNNARVLHGEEKNKPNNTQECWLCCASADVVMRRVYGALLLAMLVVCRVCVLSLGVCGNRDGWLVAWGLCGSMLIRFSTVWLLPFTLL